MLCISIFLTANPAHAGAAEDLTSYKELQQSKWDAQKESHQKDIDALNKQIEAANKRIDDQLTNVVQDVESIKKDIKNKNRLVKS